MTTFGCGKAISGVGMPNTAGGMAFQLNLITELTMMCVFGRLMSQLADVNTQLTVGMFHFYDVSHCCFCTPCCLYTVV